MFDIVERFITLSGEAPIPGKPVLLIRFAGCNLSCEYCDTPYKNEIQETRSIDELRTIIVNETKRYPGLSVLLTGGEPLWCGRAESILQLVAGLPDIHFYIETNGACPIPATDLSNIHFVTDWKAPSSGHEGSFLAENLATMKPDRDCLKIVIAKNDLTWTLQTVQFLSSEHPRLPIYLSPQWESITPAECAVFILDNALPVSLSLQMHKIIWGDKRGV